MKILVVGGGGREHAICWKLSKEANVDKIYCAPGNAGISNVAQCIDIQDSQAPGQKAVHSVCKEGGRKAECR